MTSNLTSSRASFSWGASQSGPFVSISCSKYRVEKGGHKAPDGYGKPVFLVHTIV